MIDLDVQTVVSDDERPTRRGPFALLRGGRPRRVKAHWGADPYDRSQARYWNGRRWTEHVVIDGRQAIDWPTPGVFTLPPSIIDR
jgi:hypothetical protein